MKYVGLTDDPEKKHKHGSPADWVVEKSFL